MAGKLLEALYNFEIEKQLQMDRFKTASKVPVPIQVDTIQSVVQRMNSDDCPCPSKQAGYSTTQCLTLEECVAETLDCFVEALTRTHSGESSAGPLLPEFDKDDDLAMRFVTATSNLRSYIFQIEPIQSYYSAKGIAGNIIPAIATTNAIVAGLQILQAFHILKKQMEGKVGELKSVCRYTYCLRDKTRKGLYLQPTTLPDPNPNCFVCRNATIDLSLSTHLWTLDQFITRIIKKELGFFEPSISIGDNIIYEEGDGADGDIFAANMSKTLSQLPAGGIKQGTLVKVEDFSQDLEVEIIVSHRDQSSEDTNEDLDFTIGGEIPFAKDTVNASTEKDDIELI
jgi:ubiquitin-like 1-activating enzyme E1 B